MTFPTRPPARRRAVASLTALAVGSAGLAAGLTLAAAPALAASADPAAAGTLCGTNAATGGRASASSGDAAKAADGNLASRWESAHGVDPQTWTVDLGALYDVCGVSIHWEAAYAKDFTIATSVDGTTWTTGATVTDGTGGTDLVQTLDVDADQVRYVRFEGTRRATSYGYSFWELEVLTTGDPTEVPPPAKPTSDVLGENVLVFDPSMPTADIQYWLDTVFEQQETNQFGEERYELLFEPGDYDVTPRVGFYTTVAGLGKDPGDVTLAGINVDAFLPNSNATQDFWRSAENLTIGGDAMWAVAQAAPMRRVHVEGDLAVHSSGWGWASGGYIADSAIDGAVSAWTQQQFYTRDSSVGEWQGTLWNMVFSGVEGTLPAGSDGGAGVYPDPPVTDLETTGAVREKPYLYVDDAGDYRVFVPAEHDGTTGTTWADGSTPGTSLGLDDFYVAHPGDSAATINAALATGKNLLLTPGVYRTDETIDVTRPDTVVLGLGYATIIPEDGQTAMHVADADGITVAGILFDAGPVESPSMLTVGDAGKHTDHADDPIAISDIFVRVGGGSLLGKVDSAIVVNADDTLVDHVWSWRADHGDHVGWDVNTSDYGFVVNGDDVSAYGLFVEHYQRYNTLWNGEGGRTIFYQNELPYDVPDQAAWQNGSTRGYAAYKVADSVRTHEAWGLGSYSNFTSDTEETEIVVDGGFEVPKTPGVAMHHMVVVSLGGEGIYEHVINGVGPKADGPDTIPSYVADYVTEAPAVPAWSSSSVYTSGDRVTVDGRLFEAQWWTQGEKPGASPWGSWQEIATAKDGTAVWTASRVFTTGDVVVHDGVRYTAQWWTRNQEPGASPWGPWKVSPAA